MWYMYVFVITVRVQFINGMLFIYFIFFSFTHFVCKYLGVFHCTFIDIDTNEYL